MNDSVIVAIISASASIFVAALTFYLTKRHELNSRRQSEKLNHYKVLLSSISCLAGDVKDNELKNNFALASNTIALAAPQ
ncbi:hypothetical protein RP726_20965 (plasmid) [Candidatus Methylospira mobilis]|uniref:hypothetical protein n=1 Tax=Candidatus Methylospira mobilis TaxID=1808979 RepID=UPI0028E7758B|nr:hypothetical protein [Candidatus Methylospira mobilis]WNV06925.1 hypothetical protein RP726_20965 [Candidatus Methylospira mobilis]